MTLLLSTRVILRHSVYMYMYTGKVLVSPMGWVVIGGIL